MTTTTSYGTWSNRVYCDSLSVEQTVEGAIGGDCTAEQVAEVASRFRAAINAALPGSVSLCGNEFLGAAYRGDRADQDDYPHDEDGRLDLFAIVDGVDFWGIVEQVAP